MKLKGSVVLVTGGASGLGRATAEHLLRLGARVAILDLEPEETTDDLRARWPGDCLHHRGDTSREQDVAAVLDLVDERLGVLRAAVSCAGISAGGNTLGWSGAAPLEDFERVVRINLVGTYNVARLAAERIAQADPLEDGERGIIVNTASAAAFEGQSGQVAYAATKAGIVGMTLPMARDLGTHGIRVVSLAPGIFDTAMLDALPTVLREPLLRHPVFPQRAGMPEEFAELVGQVLTNRMLNGTTIRVDAGIRLPP